MRKSDLIIVVSFILVGVTLAKATPDEAPCGVIVRADRGTQIIPKTGSVQTRFVVDAPINCGSMVITHDSPFWMKYSDQTVIKIGPKSFIEVPKSGSDQFSVYRGQAFISAPPGVSTQTWKTPNAEMIYKGGIAYFEYEPDSRTTSASSFNREFEFRNKFNESAKVTVKAGEISRLAIRDEKNNPSIPVVMNHKSVTEALAGFHLTEEDRSELVASVKRVFDDRAKSLIAEVEAWDTGADEKVEREIASVKPPRKTTSKKAPVSAVDPEEAKFATAMMKKRLYGDENEVEKLVPVNPKNGRSPASVRVTDQLSAKISEKIPEKIVDTEETKNQQNFKKEVNRTIQEIDRASEEE